MWIDERISLITNGFPFFGVTFSPLQIILFYKRIEDFNVRILNWHLYDVFSIIVSMFMKKKKENEERGKLKKEAGRQNMKSEKCLFLLRFPAMFSTMKIKTRRKH